MSEIKLIVFDLWNTLAYKKNNSNHKSLQKMLDKTGSDIPMDKFVKIFENSTQTKKWKNEKYAYENLCKNMKLECNNKNINSLMIARRKVETKFSIYKNTIPMLKKLRKAGYSIGIISNSTPFVIKRLSKKTKILDYINFPLFSFDIGVVKPNLKLYKAMLKRAGAKPSETIMIGDNPDDDVFPARKLGINSIHYKNFKQLKKDFGHFGINL